MTKILFVDDEPRILDGLRRTLRAQRDRWDMTFSLGGQAALEELAGAPFDVVVSDMRMPRVDGLALLTAVRDRWPHVVRIILSGEMDLETAVRSVSVAHQFLTKPCDPAQLEAVIARTSRLNELIASPRLRAVVGGVGALPAAPAVYARLERAVADPMAGLTDVVRVIECDVSLTAKILQVVNSSFFGLPRRVTTIEHAVGCLGVNVIRALVLSHELAVLHESHRAAPGFSMSAYQTHALRVGQLARRILAGTSMADDAFLAGVLLDVGELLLATRCPKWLAATTAHAAEHQLRPFEAELAVHGVTHAEVGACLIGLWGLPFRIVESIAHHHVPSRADSGTLDVLAAVHIADALVTECEQAAAGAAPAPSILDETLVASLGVGAKLAGWREAAHAQTTDAGADP